MSDRLTALRRSVDQPPAGFDWDENAWREAGERVLRLVAAASTDWESRRPSPDHPDDALKLFSGPTPQDGVAFEELMTRIEREVLPTSAYNGHPRWLAYIMGAPAPVSVLGDLIASSLNQNSGLWRVTPSSTAIEVQTLSWIAEMLGFPSAAEGIFLSGGQMANIVAHAVIRDAKVPWDARAFGVRGFNGNAPQLRIYASSELHYCHEQAAEILGMGRQAVRKVPVDESYRMRLDLLAQMIAEDRSRGDLPIAIVGTAGTVGTGAIDPIPELVSAARDEGLWLHIDGAYGAFATLADNCSIGLRALSDANSVVCDPHKWLFSAIDAGVLLVREAGRLERSFAFHASYLETADRGARVDFLERGPENSRPQRAFKVWLSIQAFGRDGYAAMIDYNIRLAAYLEELVRATPGLALAAPRELSIVCWRVELEGLDRPALEELQVAVIEEIERRGIAMLSNARLQDGRTAIRACITNFRTRAEDMEKIVKASAQIGSELAAKSRR
ncbi:MAG: aspartate aminotransferase family protein [Chloroflexi bacterium]|nr:MAG: aspartate aminotransferase family protein [Chloroflexota bacterium]